MTDISTIALKNIDSEDLSDVLVKVEKSFGFKFGKTELKEINSFGELCDIIQDKVKGDNLQDCTTQQAFYKLRDTICVTLNIDRKFIMTETNLLTLFPRNSRRKRLANIENELGFKIKILRPKHWVAGTLVLILIASFIGLFFYWRLGLVGLTFSFIGLKLADKFANEFDLQTVRQVAEKITRENYLKARRKPGTINKDEITKEVIKLFRADLDLSDEVLTRDATFV